MKKHLIVDTLKQTRLVLKDKDEIKRAQTLGISDFRKKYSIMDMVKGDVIFCATAITDGDMLKGINDKGTHFEAHSFVLHKSQNISKKVKNIIKK